MQPKTNAGLSIKQKSIKQKFKFEPLYKAQFKYKEVRHKQLVAPIDANLLNYVLKYLG